jgi:hypothetical protein
MAFVQYKKEKKNAPARRRASIKVQMQVYVLLSREYAYSILIFEHCKK